jgi:hypothetical protein
MNIKSLLIGSAAALAAVSGAQAADAIVAAEPEPMEYVRVCDAFGEGYFYIPGTETCLSIRGFVRFQVDFAENAVGNDAGYRAFSRAHLDINAKSDTEYGALTSSISLEGDSDADDALAIDSAFIEFAGFQIGYFYNYWDKGINGETDSLDGDFLGIVGAETLHNAIAYKYEGGAFSVGAALEAFDNKAWRTFDSGANGNSLGISGIVTGSFGAVSVDLLGSYDFDAENGAIRGLVSAEIGPGTLQGAAVWSSGASRYWDASEWSVAASYKANLTDKLAITPGFQYWGTIDYNGNLDYVGSRDAWRAGITLDYEIVKDLTTKVSLQYTDVDGPRGGDKGGQDDWGGFVRLQRSF